MSGADDDIAALVAALEAAPEGPTKTTAHALVREMLVFHARALGRMSSIMRKSDLSAVLERFAEDPLVASMLLLHDLHPVDLAERARAAVDRLNAAYPDLELVAVEDGHVRLRMGARGGATPPVAVVESALLEAVPDARSIEVHVATAATELVTLRRKAPAS